jgi:hypothetical protein
MMLFCTGDRWEDILKTYVPIIKLMFLLQIQGYESIEPNADIIWNELKASRGFKVKRKLHPEDIKTVLKWVKKHLKAIALYREKLIEIKEDGIYLITEIKKG